MGRPAGADDHPTKIGRSTAFAQSYLYMPYLSCRRRLSVRLPAVPSGSLVSAGCHRFGLLHLALPFGGVALSVSYRRWRGASVCVSADGESGAQVFRYWRAGATRSRRTTPSRPGCARSSECAASGDPASSPSSATSTHGFWPRSPRSSATRRFRQRTRCRRRGSWRTSRISGRPALRTKRCGRWAGSTASCGNYRHCNPWRGRSRVGDMPPEPEVAVHRVHAVERLPRSVNGKIQRPRLMAGLGDDRVDAVTGGGPDRTCRRSVMTGASDTSRVRPAGQPATDAVRSRRHAGSCARRVFG